jgi:hypothetical protein
LVLSLLVAMIALLGCQAAKEAAPSAGAPEKAPAHDVKDAPKTQNTIAGARAPSPRKVIFKAELSVEVRSPADAQSKVTALVEREGGFIASAARDGADERPADVTLVLRVPAERFNAVLAEIRRLGDGKRAERIDSEDVTDEYVDLEARLRVQTRLEEQLLELLKTATTVEAALKVHGELANVRTDIERIHGRKQLLERDVTLSTVKVSFTAPPAESVSFSKIGRSFSQAYDDAILVGGGIIVAAIRMMGVLVPVAVMLGVPVLLAVFVVRRRMRRGGAS